MRLRSFTAPTIAEAMRQVRLALGDDAVILATEEQGRSVKITAAIDPHAAAALQPMADARSASIAPGGPAEDEPAGALAGALRFHGVPQALMDRLLAMTATFEIGDAQQALTAAFRARFTFRPLTDQPPGKPILLAGLPGAGKSSTLAKLAARAKVNGWPVTAITCDLAKAGAVEQLATYAKALEIPAYRAKDAATLKRAVARADAKGMILIDTIGTNPLLPGDLAELRNLVAAVGGELVLVMAAGGDTTECAELAAAYAEAGATRLIATKIDLARRYGGILAAAEAGQLAFAGFGTSPQIASGLAAPRADRLCRLFLPAAATPPAHGPTPAQGGKRQQAGSDDRPQAQPSAKQSPSKPLRGAVS
jgi:flagellar biosynthesis protein FlhF